MITIQVNGSPAPQGSKRLIHGVMVEASRGLPAWRESIRAETQRVMKTDHILRGPVRAELAFLMRRPKAHYNGSGLRKGAPTVPAIVPDIDKLCRAALDGLVNGGAMEDDSQVTTLVAKKLYSEDGRVGLYIRLSEDK